MFRKGKLSFSLCVEDLVEMGDASVRRRTGEWEGVYEFSVPVGGLW